MSRRHEIFLFIVFFTPLVISGCGENFLTEEYEIPSKEVPPPTATLNIDEPAVKPGEKVEYEGECNAAEDESVNIESCNLWVTVHGNVPISGSVSFKTPEVKTFRLTATDSEGQESKVVKDVYVYNPEEEEVINKQYRIQTHGGVSKKKEHHLEQWTDNGVQLADSEEMVVGQVQLEWTAYYSGHTQNESEHHGLWLKSKGEDDRILSRVMDDADDNINPSGSHNKPVALSTTINGGEITPGEEYHFGAYHEKWRYPKKKYPGWASVHFEPGEDWEFDGDEARKLTISYSVVREK